MKKISEKNRSVCSKHKRHRFGGEFQIANMAAEEIDKFNEQINGPLHNATNDSSTNVNDTTDLEDCECKCNENHE